MFKQGSEKYNDTMKNTVQSKVRGTEANPEVGLMLGSLSAAKAAQF